MNSIEQKYTKKAMLYSTIGFLIGCGEFAYMMIYPDSWFAQNSLKCFIWFPVFLVFIFEWRKMKIKKSKESSTKC